MQSDLATIDHIIIHIKLISKSTFFFLVLLTITSLLFPQVAAKNIILLPGKKRDTKIAYHESFKEYCHKERKIFVPYILGEYTRKGHEYVTLIKITTIASKKKNSKWKKKK